DGTVLTQDCPVGLRLLRMRIAKLGGGLAAAIAMLIGSAVALANPWKHLGFTRLRGLEPVAKLSQSVERAQAWLRSLRPTPPPPPGALLMALGGGRIDRDELEEWAQYLKLCGKAKARKAR